jgi:predicted dehydrogenase
MAVIERDSRAELSAVVPGPPSAAAVTSALDGSDAAVICSTTAGHHDWLRHVVAGGVPALVEKPLAATAEETAVLTGLIRRARRPVTTAMFLRCAPALRRARTLLAGRELGEIVGAGLRFSHAGLLDGVFDAGAGWMLDPARGGTGAFADLGVHLIDLLCWLRPGARIAVRGAFLRGRPDMAVDTGGSALLDWDGVPTTLHAGWTARPGGVRLRVEGTRGTLTVRGGTLRLRGRDAGTYAGDHVEEYAPPSAGDATTAFLAGLRGGASWQPPCAADMALCAQVLAETAAEAARECR